MNNMTSTVFNQMLLTLFKKKEEHLAIMSSGKLRFKLKGYVKQMVLLLLFCS